MSWMEFLTSAALILAVMAALSLLESAIPFFERGSASRGRWRANLSLTGTTLLLNWALNSAVAATALIVSFEGRGLLAPIAARSPIASLAITVLTLDLATWLAHRSMHSVPFLWRVHRVHHSDPFVDVTTTLRQHPIEGLWRFLFLLIPTWGLGLPLSGVLAYRALSAVQAALEHANIRLWPRLDRFFVYFWCTPNMHKIHHSRVQAETDSNYGNLFAFFDRGFRTFTPTHRARGVAYGLADADPSQARQFSQLMRWPLLGRMQPVAPNGPLRS